MKRTIDIDLIKENPLSENLFGDLPEKEFELLKEDIKDGDVQIPIEVTLDYTVITGHQRLRAKRALGFREIEVDVREDLKSEEEVEEHLIKDNLLRRHLSLEQKVKVVEYLVEKYGGLRGRPPKKGQVAPFLAGKGKTREKVATILGISERSVDKYLKVARLPREERDKVLKKKIRMKEALADHFNPGDSSTFLPAEAFEEGAEQDSFFANSFAREFDPLEETEAAKCVKCGRDASVSEGYDADVHWFVARLVREFVKDSRRDLCTECLSGLYGHLGRHIRRQWRGFLAAEINSEKFIW